MSYVDEFVCSGISFDDLVETIEELTEDISQLVSEWMEYINRAEYWVGIIFRMITEKLNEMSVLHNDSPVHQEMFGDFQKTVCLPQGYAFPEYQFDPHREIVTFHGHEYKFPFVILNDLMDSGDFIKATNEISAWVDELYADFCKSDISVNEEREQKYMQLLELARELGVKIVHKEF